MNEFTNITFSPAPVLSNELMSDEFQRVLQQETLERLERAAAEETVRREKEQMEELRARRHPSRLIVRKDSSISRSRPGESGTKGTLGWLSITAKMMAEGPSSTGASLSRAASVVGGSTGHPDPRGEESSVGGGSGLCRNLLASRIKESEREQNGGEGVRSELQGTVQGVQSRNATPVGKQLSGRGTTFDQHGDLQKTGSAPCTNSDARESVQPSKQPLASSPQPDSTPATNARLYFPSPHHPTPPSPSSQQPSSTASVPFTKGAEKPCKPLASPGDFHPRQMSLPGSSKPPVRQTRQSPTLKLAVSTPRSPSPKTWPPTRRVLLEAARSQWIKSNDGRMQLRGPQQRLRGRRDLGMGTAEVTYKRAEEVWTLLRRTLNFKPDATPKEIIEELKPYRAEHSAPRRNLLWEMLKKDLQTGEEQKTEDIAQTDQLGSLLHLLRDAEERITTTPAWRREENQCPVAGLTSVAGNLRMFLEEEEAGTPSRLPLRGQEELEADSRQFETTSRLDKLISDVGSDLALQEDMPLVPMRLQDPRLFRYGLQPSGKRASMVVKSMVVSPTSSMAGRQLGQAESIASRPSVADIRG